MTNPDTETGQHEATSEFEPGMPVRVRNTAGTKINGEFMPTGITGLVEKIENGKVYVAYRIPGDSPRRDKATSTVFPYEPSEIEKITS